MKMNKLIVLAAVAVAAMGCQKNNLDNNTDSTTPEAKGVPVVISAGVDEKNTRISYDDPDQTNKMAFHWTPEDKISLSVVGMDANANCEFTTQSEQKTGKFEGEVGASWNEEKTVFGVFPYTATGYYTGEDNSKPIVVFSLPEVQTYTVGGNLSNSIMVACAKASSEKEITLNFKQKTAIIRLNIANIPATKKVTKVDLKCAGGRLTMDYIIYEDDAESYTETQTSGFTTNVVGASIGKDTRVDVVVLPDLTGEVVGKNFTLKVTLADENGANEESKEIVKTAP